MVVGKFSYFEFNRCNQLESQCNYIQNEKKGFFVNNMSDLDYIEVSYMLKKNTLFFSYYTNTYA